MSVGSRAISVHAFTLLYSQLSSPPARDIGRTRLRCRNLLAEDLLPAAYLVTGKLGPDYEGVEMSVGSKAIGGAIQEATGVTRQKLSSMYKELGDLGDVAQACRHNQVLTYPPPPPLGCHPPEAQLYVQGARRPPRLGPSLPPHPGT